MKIDEIITLTDNKDFMLLEEAELDNNKYFLAVELDKNEEPLENYKIFEYKVVENKDTVTEVIDKELITKLLTLYSLELTDMLEKMYKEQNSQQ